MTATPEERARSAEIWAAADLADTKDEAEAIIAQAIREAEDAAIERAEIACTLLADQHRSSSPLTPYIEGRADAADRLAHAIRALKHNKD